MTERAQPPPDASFVNPTFYVEDAQGQPVDWRLLTDTGLGRVSRFVLSKDQYGDAVFTCRIEAHEEGTPPVDPPPPGRMEP